MAGIDDIHEDLWDFATGECSYCHKTYVVALIDPEEEDLLFTCNEGNCTTHNCLELNITFKAFQYVKCDGCL